MEDFDPAGIWTIFDGDMTNAEVYKTAVGKVEEIFGPIHSAMFTVKMAEGVHASSYAAGDKFYVSSEKLLPLARFLPGAKPAGRGRGPAPRPTYQ